MEQNNCRYCNYYASKGAKYCPRCGRDLSGMSSSGCPRCADQAAAGARYCRYCGNYLGEGRTQPYPSGMQDGPEHPFMRGTVTAVTLLFILLCTASLIVYTVHVGDVLGIADRYSYSIYVPLGLVNAFSIPLRGNAFRAYILIAYVLFALFLAYAVISYQRTAGKYGMSSDRTEHSGLSAAASCLSVSLFLSIVYLLLMSSAGADADSSWMDDFRVWDLNALLFMAGLNEELAFRLVWIGIPMALLGFLWKKDRRSLQYLMGGFGMSKAALVFIIISSIIFGLAHYDGWGWVKIIDAAAGGIIFGYLYTEYGLYASVLAHFLNDTVTVFAGGVLGELALMAAGAVILVYWLVKPNRELLDLKGMPDMTESLPPMKDQWGRH